MSRLVYPEPDRWYLPAIEIVEYDIRKISESLRLGSDDPDPKGFRSAYQYSEHLMRVIRLGAIQEERRDFPPIIVRGIDE